MTALLALGMPNGIEWIVILFVVLILFGAKRLPELARGLGKSMSEFKKAREDFETELQHGAAEGSTPSVTVREPASRQPLALNPSGVNSGQVEQQVRELQEQLKEMQRQNEALQSAATAGGGGVAVAAANTVPHVATPAAPSAPVVTNESITEPPSVSIKM